MAHKRDLTLLHRVHGKRFPKMYQVRHIFHLLSSKEKQLLKVSLLALLIGLVWGTSIGLGEYRQQVPKVGGRYVEAVIGSPQLVNPLFSTVNDVDQDLVRLVYDGLLRHDEEQRLQKNLAATYDISEDKKTYTFQLRKDVFWHDGQPLTARDVIFTFDRIQQEKTGSPLFVTFQGVTVEMVDEYTVRFVLKEPFAPFLSSLTTGILPEHVWFDIPAERMRLAKENLQPVGTGPFLFAKLSKDETGYVFRYELKRYKDYHREPAFIEEFAFQFYPQYDGDIGAIPALREKRVDGLHFVPSDLREKVERKHIRLHTLQLPQYTALFFNQTRLEALKDINVRTALAYTLDKDRILREAIRDEGHVIYSPILPGFPGHDPEIERTPYNVSEANTLLDKTWERISAEEYRQKKKDELTKEFLEQIGEGEEASTSTLSVEQHEEIERVLNEQVNPAQTFYRENDDGEILEIQVVTADTQEYRNTANLIVSFWHDIGVTVDIKFVHPRDISREVLKDRSYDILLYGAIIGSDPDQYPFWHSSQINFPGLNLAKYVNRTVDGFLEKGRESTDEAEVADYYKQFQQTLLEEVPAVFLYTPTYTYATDGEVQGINLSRIFSPADRFANVTGWYIKTKGQWTRTNQ